MKYCQDASQFDDMREICQLIYQLNLIQFEESLWNTYLKSNEESSARNRSQPFTFWPTMVINTMYDQNKRPVTEETCRRFVQNKLDAFHEQRNIFEQHYQEKKKRFDNYERYFEPSFIQFIRQQIQPFRLHYESQIQLYQFNHQLELLEKQLCTSCPLPSQTLIRNLRRSHFEWEKIRCERKLVDEMLRDNRLCDGSQAIAIHAPISTQPLIDEKLREEFHRHQQQILQKFQLSMVDRFKNILTHREDECKQRCDLLRNEYHQCKNGSNTKHPLTSKMCTIIDEMLKMITDQLTVAFQDKRRQFEIQDMFPSS